MLTIKKMQTKICYRCKKLISITQFRKRKKYGNEIFQPYCLQCQREYDREYWHKTKDRRHFLKRILDKKLRIRNRKFIKDHLKNKCCIDCGENDPIVLEFDHKKNKLGNISDLINRKISISRLILEIDKCEIRCANCHRRKTAKESKWHTY